MKELYCLHLSILKRLVCFCVMNPVSILTQLAFFFFFFRTGFWTMRVIFCLWPVLRPWPKVSDAAEGCLWEEGTKAGGLICPWATAGISCLLISVQDCFFMLSSSSSASPINLKRGLLLNNARKVVTYLYEGITRSSQK